MGVGTRGLVITDMDSLWRFSTCVFKSGLAPKGFANPESILVAIQLGLELGISPMCALQNIALINGRPSIYGDAAKALVEESRLMEYFDEHPGQWCDDCEKEANAAGQCPNRGCQVKDISGPEFHGYVVTSKRRGRVNPIVTGFNVRMAKRAGLWGKQGPWTQYPHRMLMFRARGFNLRDNFADVLKGLRTAEETMDIPVEEPTMQALPTGRMSLKTATKPLPAPGPEAVSPAPIETCQSDPEPTQQATAKPTAPPPAKEGKGRRSRASVPQQETIQRLCEQRGQPIEALLEDEGIEVLADLTPERAQQLIDILAVETPVREPGEEG